MRSVESLSLSIIRVAEEHAMKESTGQVLVQVPVEIANYLLNEKRRALSEIEQRHDAPIVIVADEQLETPHYEVTRVRENELGEETARPSYQRGTPRKLPTHALNKSHLNIPDLPAVTNVRPAQPAPLREPREVREEALPATVTPVMMAAKPKAGLFAKIMSFFGTEQAPQTPEAAQPSRPQELRGRNDRNGQRRDQRNGGRPQREGRRDEPRRNQPQAAQGQAQSQPTQPAKQQQPKQAHPQPQNAPKPPRQQQPKRQDASPRPPRGETATGERPASTDTAQAAASFADANPVMPISAAGPLIAADETQANTAQAELAHETNTVIEAGSPASVAADTVEGSDDGSGEGARRRRGRRGGRRRRRGGAEGAGDSDTATRDDTHDGEVAIAQRSQPEFDFDEEGPVLASEVPATSAAATVPAPQPDAQTAAPMAVQSQPVAAAPANETHEAPVGAAVATPPVTPTPQPLPVASRDSEPAIEAAVAARESAQEIRLEAGRVNQGQAEASSNEDVPTDRSQEVIASDEHLPPAHTQPVAAETPPPSAQPSKTRNSMRPSAASQGEIIQSQPLSAAIAVSLAESAYRPVARSVAPSTPAPTPPMTPAPTPAAAMSQAEPNPGLPANVPVATDVAPIATMAPDDLGSGTDVATLSSVDAATRTPGLFDEVAAPMDATPADTAAQIVSAQDDAAAQPENSQGV